MLEKTSFKFDNLAMSGETTPPTESFYVYALNTMIPNDLTIEATCTYQQLKGDANNGQLRTACNSVSMPTSFFLRLVEPQKDNLESKIQFSMAGTNKLGSLPEVFSDMFDSQRCDESFK